MPAATLIVAVPPLLAVGVNVAVRVRPEPSMAERVPPTSVRSPAVPSQEKEVPGSSVNVKVIVVLSPAFRTLAALLIKRLGEVVSRAKAQELEAGARLPAPSATATEKL